MLARRLAANSCRRLLHVSRAASNNKEQSDFDRTIKDAIEQAKRELKQEAEKEKEKETQPPDTSDDYVTTLGRVMLELPLQLEGFFEHGLDARIYADQIKFSEPRHSGIQFTGPRTQYLAMMRVMRIAMSTWFSSPTLAILALRQQQQETHLGVCVRWVFEGLPRHAEIIGKGVVTRYEGEFTYHIHPKSGRICVHEVSAIHPAPPTAVSATAGGLARWMGWLEPRGSLSLASNKNS
ncbi:hypothetical protein GGI20_001053 [Coemansia sp. BCRC 34301]|nr:hypothetical protein GGI20_001053 [Coemansia sp. BCRC 34301]